MGCSLRAGVITIATIFIVLSVLSLGKLSSNLVKYHHGHDGEHHNGHHGDKRHNGHDDENHNGYHGERHNGHDGEHHNGHDGKRHHGHDGEHHNGQHGGHHDRHHGEHHGHHKHGKHGRHHKHHHHEDRDMTTTNSPHVNDNKMLFGRDEKKLALVRGHMMETTAYPKVSDDKQKRFCHKKSPLIIGIVVNLITILFSCLMFAAVSDNVGKNQRRRNFLLPFIVWHLLGVVLFIAGGLYGLVKHRYHLPPIGFLILIIFVFLIIVGVLSTFLHIVVRYFKSLSVSGFDFAQMVDDDIKKQPLA